MVIEHGGWRFAPYMAGGARCWQVKHLTSGGNWPHSGMRFYARLGDAVAFAAEWELRNGGDPDEIVTLSEALVRYERIWSGFKESI